MKVRAVVVGIWSNIALVKLKIELYGILGGALCGYLRALFPIKALCSSG